MECIIEVNRGLYRIDPITTNLMVGRWNEKVYIHKHDVFHFIYILDGNGRFTIDATTTIGEPGMLFIIRPNQMHGFLYGEERPLSNLECTFRLLDQQGKAVDVDILRNFHSENRGIALEKPLLGSSIQVPAEWNAYLIDGFMRIIEHNDQPAMRITTSFLIGALLAKVVKMSHVSSNELSEVTVDQKIATVKQFMLVHRNRSLGLKELAECIHVTPNHLCKIFKKHTGDSPLGYFAKQRMREAARLLGYTDLPIYIIAEKMGFSDPSYFGKSFRSIYGLSPQAYRYRKLYG